LHVCVFFHWTVDFFIFGLFLSISQVGINRLMGSWLCTRSHPHDQHKQEDVYQHPKSGRITTFVSFVPQSDETPTLLPDNNARADYVIRCYHLSKHNEQTVLLVGHLMSYPQHLRAEESKLVDALRAFSLPFDVYLDSYEAVPPRPHDPLSYRLYHSIIIPHNTVEHQEFLLRYTHRAKSDHQLCLLANSRHPFPLVSHRITLHRLEMVRLPSPSSTTTAVQHPICIAHMSASPF
jgi:hypothetical protein